MPTSEVERNDLQDQQRKYRPEVLRKPASAITDSATVFWTASYSQPPTKIAPTASQYISYFDQETALPSIEYMVFLQKAQCSVMA